WHRNNGDATFASGQTFVDTFHYPTSVCAGDLDNDGDNDIVYCSQDGDSIMYAENLGIHNYQWDSACVNQPYPFGNQNLNSPGIYYDTLQTPFGLDSVIRLEFSQIALPEVSMSPFPQDTFCIQTGIIDFPMATPLGGYFAGAGITASNINLNLADTGTHDISYHFTDTATGCANSDTTQLIIIFCLSVAEEESLGISVYPNPASSFINIGFKNVLPSGEVACLLFNSTGKEILVAKPTGFPYQIDISQLKAGLYYLKIELGETAVRYKIVK
ncbi:MAG: T9SS type A sorting domain-containing protein, partial [Bacteroidales bacterium]|nr:T9SS type A sorting domain-containing protein [Bacteroidales bacterium]